MIFVLLLTILFPIELIFLTSWFFDTSFKDAVEKINTIWLFISPIWGMSIAFFSYWYGKSIEVIDNAKLAVSIAKDATPIVQSIAQKIKNKVRSR